MVHRQPMLWETGSMLRSSEDGTGVGSAFVGPLGPLTPWFGVSFRR